MMKSFFKKLAFVMALAMVVSAMAPAATAKAAEVGLCLQESTTWEIIKADELTVDEKQDYKFAGAPTNWRSLGLKWTSSDETVATVDVVTGLVTAVKAGTTTIAVKGEGYEASLELTVKSKEVAKTFEVAQKTANKAVLTFADEDTAKAAATSVTVVKVISTLAGDKYQPCVLDPSKTKVDGKTLAIEPWVPFGTATYLVTANGVTVKLETSVGEPSKATIKYEEPYTFAEAGKAAKVTLNVTDGKGVEVTDYTVYYELVKAEPAGYAYVNASTGDLYFYVDGAKATVRATIRYTVNGQNKSFAVEDEFKAEPKPVVTVNNYLEAVAVVPTNSLKATADKTEKQMKDAINWEATQIKMSDGTAQVVGLIKKSNGDSFSINEHSVGDQTWNKNQLDSTKTTYKFTYESTDSSKVIVDETTGTLVGVNTTVEGVPVYVLVTMHKKVNSVWQKVGIVAVASVDVQPKKAADYVTLGADFQAVLLTEGAHVTKEVTPKTYNQYGEEMADTIKSVTTTFNNKTYSIDSAKNQTKFTVNASDVNNYFNKEEGQPKSNYFIFKVEMNSGKSADFYLTLKEVNNDNRDNKEYKLATTSATIKADALDKKVSISVDSLVLGEKYGTASFFYGKMDSNVSGLAKGDLYVIVRDPSGDVITPATSGAVVPGNKWELPALTTAADGKLSTIETGVYNVELYKVVDIINDTDNNKKIIVDTLIDTATYTVDNKLPSGYTDLKINLKNENGIANKVNVAADGTITFKSAKTVSFKINNTAMDALTDASKITVNGITVEGSTNVFVYSLTVKYYIGEAGYVVVEVPVNQIFSR